MDLQQDLEQYRQTCMINIRGDEDTEIVIENLDHCRYVTEHSLSVKDLSSEVEANSGENPIIVHMDDGDSPSEEQGGNLQNTFSKCLTMSNKKKGFSKDKDIPDRDGSRVYDFVMTKTLTLPPALSPEEVQRLRRKWVCIGSLALSTLFLVIIVIIVLVLTSTNNYTN